MSNLKQLVWSRSLTALSPMHEYSIRKDNESTDKYMVKKTRLATQKTETVTGFESIELAKHWCYNEHYKPKMQPYIKPSPTWIDASERLPDKSGRYMVVHQTIKPVENKSTPVDIDTYDENEKAWIFFCSGIMQEVTHWMPIPEFSTMQILHKRDKRDN